MKAIQSFVVRARLPAQLSGLSELAMNLRWSWDDRTRELFRWVDPEQWDVTKHDPVRVLSSVSRARLEELANDANFLQQLSQVQSDLHAYLEAPRWFQQRDGSALRAVAYFSPEFGIAEAVPQYSGGLGVLAGDHLKAASGLGVPVVGIGLMYRQGYFRQRLSPDGWQQEHYPRLDPFDMALTAVDGARVEVELAGTPLVARIWRGDVARVRLYLLDADVEENSPDDRLVTDRLYGGATEHRLRQEILLGIGGVRALSVIGEDAQVFHTNEGHAGFLGLERIRRLVVDEGLAFDEAVEACRAGTVFTTHTPVPAGIDRFPLELMQRYFKGWADDVGVPFEQVMALGHFPGEPFEAPFNMAVMGLRLAGCSNGVSKLHGAVSRAMFQRLWPDVAEDDVPIGSVTNGVHAHTWVAAEIDDVLTRHVTPAWQEASEEDWARIVAAPDDEVWRAREQARARLVSSVQRWVGPDVFEPDVLTIGFARRFAAYKRATLLLSDPDRLRALLLSEDRPVQLVFAGKAHPADDLGKQMIQRIAQFARDPSVRHRFAFIEDYDIGVARTLYQGCDVWLNNPRRPQEACGTSGEKAALNGALNCSILDGWWAEMFDGENGWAITSFESELDVDRRDRLEAASLFEVLEDHVVPLFYDRANGLPTRWVQRVKSSLRALGPRVAAPRMVRDYVEVMYEPTATRADALRADGYAGARQLATWKARVRAAWDGVRVDHVDTGDDVVELGRERSVTAAVSLGSLRAEDVQVELVYGRVGQGDELAEPIAIPMSPTGDGRYHVALTCDRAGHYGFTVRVVPSHPHLGSPFDLGLVAWG